MNLVHVRVKYAIACGHHHETPSIEEQRGKAISEEYKCNTQSETLTRGRDEKIPTTSGIRFFEVPIVPSLERAVSTLSNKKDEEQTVMSGRARWGTRVPEGIGLGNLRDDINIKPNKL